MCDSAQEPVQIDLSGGVAKRAWCARMKVRGALLESPGYLGTVYLDAKEGEETARRHLLELLRQLLCMNESQMETFIPIPGCVYFIPDEWRAVT